MSLELVAAAKLNLTLEVIGKRPDGYHEIASVMQTIDLVDRINIEPASTLSLEVTGDEAIRLPDDAADNLVIRAAKALREEVGRPDLGARIVLEKRIPAGMGLGGGSSDAAAVLRGLNFIWRLRLDPPALARLAGTIGSDVPFFLYGGTAFVGGRGENVMPLPDIVPQRITLFVPEVDIPDKTGRAYAALLPSDFGAGARSLAMVQSVSTDQPPASSDLFNTFDRAVGESLPATGSAITACREAGVDAVVAGAGPAFFTLTPSSELAEGFREQLVRDFGVRAISCNTSSRNESMAVKNN